MSEGYIGCRIRSLDAKRYVLGSGQFIDDLKLPGMVCAHFLRSPHAHARIQHIDYSSALKAPGVLGIWTSREVAPKVEGIQSTVISASYPACVCPPLAKDKVRYAGEAVAVIVKRSAA